MTEQIKEMVESKITIGSGIILTLLFAIIVSCTTIIFNHNSRIAVNETKQSNSDAVLEKLSCLPSQLARIDEKLNSIGLIQNGHNKNTSDNNRMLKER